MEAAIVTKDNSKSYSECSPHCEAGMQHSISSTVCYPYTPLQILNQLGMRQKSRIACLSAIFQPKPDATSSTTATRVAWCRPSHKSLVPRRLFASTSSTLSIAGSSHPNPATPSLRSERDSDQDDRWHAAYLESLMKKAGELSVKGMPFSV